MSDTKIILSALKLFSSGKENEIKGKISDQENPLFWVDKKFILSDQVLQKLADLEKIKNLNFLKGISS